MFRDSTVRTRLLAGFLAVAVLGAIVAAIGIANMSTMNAQAEHAYAYDLLGMSAAKDANINLIYVGRAVRSVLLATSPAEAAKYQGVVDDARKTLAARLETARPRFYSAEGKRLLAEIDQGLADFDSARAQLMQMAADTSPEGRSAAVQFLFGPLAAKAKLIDDKMSELTTNKEKTAAASAAKAAEVYRNSRLTMIVLVLVSLACGIGIGLWITQSLTRQLGGEPAYAAEMAGAIARGELSQRIETRAGDQRSLLFAMETMRTALVKIVGQVRAGTDTIATASNQIAVGNMDLSSRTEEQASSLEETASSMEELTSTVRQNADNARQANGLAKSASEVAVRGGSVVSDVVDTMASINASSRKIVDIISVIDSIAFQTNILALNAAVEAARAGEQGRGFAVVAAEVRNLAQRAAAAAKEINTLISDSVDKVDAGGKLVNQAGVTMDDIVQSITRVTDIMAEIASASAEQSMGIDQVNTAITQMDEVTQQNAALVEQAAAAAGAMQDQAASLAEVVSIFKLGNEAFTAAVPVRPAPARAPAARLAATATHCAPAAGEDWEQF